MAVLGWLAVSGCSAPRAGESGSASGGGIPTVPGSDGSGGATDSGSSSDGDTSGPERLDVPSGGTDGPGGGDCPGDGGGGNEEYDFSIIWIANSPEGTVSKIDTKTATEIRRYRTGPDSPNPSRTSVNLRGDVAVANRAGSVTKIAARIEDCVDANNDGVILTSNGFRDVLAWGVDECVLWHHDIPNVFPNDDDQGGPRGIAWDANDNGNQCDPKPNLWVGWRNQPNNEAMVRQLDGQTGVELGSVVVPNWQGNWNHGVYGGAADRIGAFWGLGTLGTIIRVAPDNYELTRWDNPISSNPYGIALDAGGNPWLAGNDGRVWQFDVSSETFVDLGLTGTAGRLRGLAIDTQGNAWMAANDPCGLVQYDTTTNSIVQSLIALEGCATPVGVSIDAEGFVWVVDQGADLAYKVHPETYQAVVVSFLVRPYTYSDMTGTGLNLVVNPPAG